MPRPEHQLHIAGGTNTEQTARMLAAIGPLLASEAPDVVLVYGDTNSTVAGGLAAAQAQIPVVHVEAGMRSFDRRMPEELNRVLTDHLSDLLLVPSETARAQPRARGGRRARRAGRRRDGRRVDDVPAARAGASCGRCATRASSRARSSCAPRTARATSTSRSACAGWWTSSWRVDEPRRPAAAPAHRRAPGRRRLARRAGRRRARPARAAAGLHGLHLAADQRPPRADRLRRRAEGGLLRRRPVRDAARHDRVGRDGRGRLERPGRPRPRRGADRAARASRRPSARSSTATAARASASSRRSTRCAPSAAARRDLGAGVGAAVRPGGRCGGPATPAKRAASRRRGRRRRLATPGRSAAPSVS